METYYCGQHYRKPDHEPVPDQCPICGNPFLQCSNFQDEIVKPEIPPETESDLTEK